MSYYDRHSPEDFTRILESFKAEANVPLNKTTALRWVRTHRLAQGKPGALTDRAVAPNTFRDNFMTLYLSSAKRGRPSTDRVLKRFNSKYSTNVKSSTARAWVTDYRASTGQSREHRRAHFLEFYQKQDKKLPIVEIVKRYNKTKPPVPLPMKTARDWAGRAQDSTLHLPQPSRRPERAADALRPIAGALLNERSHHSDLEDEVASSSPSAQGTAPSGPDTEALPSSSRAARPQAKVQSEPLRTETLDANLKRKRGMRAHPLRDEFLSFHVEHRKGSSLPQIVEAFNKTRFGPVSLVAATKWTQAADQAQGASSIGARSPERALGPGGQIPGLGHAGTNPASSPQAPAQSGEQALEEEPLVAPPFDYFLDYFASHPSDPIFVNSRTPLITPGDLLADVDELGDSITETPDPAPQVETSAAPERGR